jgi:hypothetical protein
MQPRPHPLDHDIVDCLTAILGFAQLGQVVATPENPLLGYLTIIADTTERLYALLTDRSSPHATPPRAFN